MLNKMKTFLVVPIVVLTLILSLGPAGSAEQESDGGVTVNFQNVDIQTVINSVSRITGRTFIVDPRVKGKVTVVASQEVSEESIYPIFHSRCP